MFKKIINILCILIVMIFVITVIPKGFENDLFFDLKTGESILKYGIDFKDHFSFIPNLIYIYHHWLYDVIIYFVHNVLGNAGIFLFFNLFFTIFGISVYCVNKKRTNNKFISLLIALFTVFISSYAFQSRVQSITYLLFFLEVLFIERLYETGKSKYSFYIVVLSIIIVNIHMPIWILSIILFLPYIFEFLFKFIIDKSEFLRRIISDRLIIRYPKNKKIFIITFIVLLFTGLLSPLKFYPYTFFIKSLFNNSYSFIGEMSKTALMYHSFIYEIILIIIFIILLFIKNVKVKLRDLLLILGLFVFSLIANRNVIYVYIFYPTIFIKIVSESSKVFETKFEKITNFLKKINTKIITLFVIIFLLVIYIIQLYKYSIYFNKYNYVISLHYPVESVKYIKDNLDYKNIKLYNEFGYGSYLEFNDIPVFIDSRAEVYIKEFNGGKDIISDYKKVDNFSDYSKIFEKYNFDYALTEKYSNIYYYLKSDLNFEVIFEEESFVLFKKIL